MAITRMNSNWIATGLAVPRHFSVLLKALASNRGTVWSARGKTANVAAMWKTTAAAELGAIPSAAWSPMGVSPLAEPVSPRAMARTTYTTVSSTTATASTTRAKLVCRMPRSNMMREITGMLVTAMASAKTRTSAASL